MKRDFCNLIHRPRIHFFLKPLVFKSESVDSQLPSGILCTDNQCSTKKGRMFEYYITKILIFAR